MGKETLKAEEDVAEKGRRAIEEYEEKEEAKRQQIAKKFDVKALAASTRKIYTLNVPGLGVVRYGLLTSNEAKKLKLKDVADDEERMYRVAFAMLRKADASITQEDFDALPFDAKAVVTEALAKVMPSFLPPQQPSGSPQTTKPKK